MIEEDYRQRYRNHLRSCGNNCYDPPRLPTTVVVVVVVVVTTYSWVVIEINFVPKELHGLQLSRATYVTT